MSGTVLGGFTGRAVAGPRRRRRQLAGGVRRARRADGGRCGRAVAVAAAGAARTRCRSPRSAPRHRSMHLLRNRRLVATCAVGFCILFTQVAMFTYVTFHLAAPPYSLSTVALGWLFVVYLVGAAVMPFVRALDRQLRTSRRHRLGDGDRRRRRADDARCRGCPAIVCGLALCATGVFIAQATASSYIGAVTTQDRALGGRPVFDVLLRRRERRRRAAGGVVEPRRLARMRRAHRRRAGGGRRARVHAVDAGAGEPRRGAAGRACEN